MVSVTVDASDVKRGCWGYIRISDGRFSLSKEVLREISSCLGDHGNIKRSLEGYCFNKSGYA